MQNLRAKTLKGLFWNLAESLGIRLIQFIPALLLARLLSPDEFGLIGMLAIFIALTQLFLDSGFGTALIQKKDATYLDECSVFYFNLLVGVLAVVVLFFVAPLVAKFYDQPILTALLRWLSIDLLITAFGLIQNTILTRRMDFKSLLKANVVAALAGGIFGVLAAYAGLGVWSLVIQTVANTIFQTIALWVVCDWRPALLFSLSSLRSMYGFGLRMLSSSLIDTFFNNLYQVFIGKVFSASLLGYYARASSLKDMVANTTSHVLGRVLYPAMVAIQDDPERLKRAYRKSMMMAAFFHFPLMIGLIVTAKPLIIVLFSEKWESSVVFFQWMCVAAFLYPLHLLNLNILRAKGRADLYLNLSVIRRVLVIVNVVITYRWGITAILIGQAIFSILIYFLNSYYSKIIINYSAKEQLRDTLPSLLIAGLAGAGMLLAGGLKISPAIFLLIFQAGMGVAIYLILSSITKSEVLSEIIKLIIRQWKT